MNSLTVARIGEVDAVPSGFEDRLVWLCRFGVPRVSRADNGWHARIEMNTNTTGSKFEVVTQFDHPTPSAAVEVLINRMMEALAALCKT